jgi:hypothetical protein
MGLFTNYNKEGPGVYEDDVKHGPFISFFQIYGSKFFKLCTTNLIFMLFNIPSVIIAYFAAVFFLPMINTTLSPVNFEAYMVKLGIAASDGATVTGNASMQLYFLLLLFTVMFAVGMLLVVNGPAQTGLSYLYRNFSRGTPIFLWSDFITSFKKNWKQSLIASVIGFVVSALTVFNIGFYNTAYSGKYSQVFSTIFVVLFIFVICIQMYVYPLIASVDLKLKDVYRDAVLLFLGRLVPTLGIFLINVILLVVVPVLLLFTLTNFGIGIAIIYYLFFAFSFVHFMNTFFVWRQIERFVAKPENEDAEEGSDTEPAEDDDEPEEDSDEDHEPETDSDASDDAKADISGDSKDPGTSGNS